MMAKLRGRGPGGPSDDYLIEDTWWQKADPRTGRPGIIGAEHRATGAQVVIRQWPRREAVDDGELSSIWRDEVRQLNRLKGLPRTAGRLATLRDAFEEVGAFTLILDCDERRPLQNALDRTTGRQWFRTPRTPNSRYRLWQEARRVAEALEILHAQGLLHRNLDASAILTSAGPEPDFMLTGFEWSMRLSSLPSSVSAGRRARRGPAGEPLSFYDDWRALGRLIARILGFADVARKGEPFQPDVSGEAEWLTAPERNLLRELLAGDPLKRLDGPYVVDRVDRILEQLRQSGDGGQPKLVLALRLDPRGGLARTIRTLSEDVIALDDDAAQRRFVRDAITGDSRIVRIRSGAPGGQATYSLVCERITLPLQPYAPDGPGEAREPTWSLAVASKISDEGPAHVQIEAERRIEGIDVEVISEHGRALRERALRLYGLTTRWDGFLKPPPSDPVVLAMADPTYSALMLVQTLDMLFQASRIWPVAVVGRGRSTGAATVVELVPRDDGPLKGLSDALGLKEPPVRFAAAFRDGMVEVDGEWHLTEDASLGRSSGRSIPLQFLDTRGEGVGTRYRFEGADAGGLAGDLYLRSGGAGHATLLDRRLRALRGLREHGELLTVLRDPTGDVRPSRDDPAAIAPIESTLDPSKFAALKSAWEQLPLFLVQGPPGVGKTKLVEALVSRRLADAPTERLLISAQSHAAVDHLLEQVRRVVGGAPSEEGDEILPVRCRPGDRGVGDGAWDMARQARDIAARFADSPLLASMPSRLRLRARRLAASYTPEAAPVVDDAADEGASSVDRSFDALLLRSANLVFASTNSRELGQLLEERGQFDWSIVEEAAKATGVELLSPMMLSHRRLLIGDHQQLPPFDSIPMRKLLEDPGAVRRTLKAGHEFVAPLFRRAELEEALEAVGGSDVERLAGAAWSMFKLFETFVTRHVLERDPKARGAPIGQQLLLQHRMHPSIAEMVSAVFYDRKVETYPPVAERFAKAEPPVRSRDASILPDAPIVFIDVPFGRETVGMSSPEALPRWVNQLEADACLKVLELLEPSAAHRPSLAILSPYRRQMALIDRRIADSSAMTAHLDGSERAGEEWCGTVDSFQGNEADMVVVSLVRNNHRAGLAGLGFLSEPQRMNVLLSRAKWRLIVIGSLEFLRARFQAEERVEENHPLAFLRRLIDHVDAASAGGADADVRIVPLETLMGATP